MYQCPLCHKLDNKEFLCDKCLIFIKSFIKNKNYCQHCGKSIASNSICGSCSSNTIFIDQFWASYYYEPPISKLIQTWKFNAKIQYSSILAKTMLLNPPVWINLHHIDGIIAMPTTIQSFQKRLFNQSWELAKIISQYYHIPIWNHRYITKHNHSFNMNYPKKKEFPM